MKKIVLFSGGVDGLVTTLMLLKAKEDFRLLYCGLANKYESQEISTVEKLTKMMGLDWRWQLMDFSGVGEVEDKVTAEIKLRNDLLVMAAVMLGATDVYLSIENGTEINPAKDRSKEFRVKLGEYLSWREGHIITIHNLVEDMTKEEEMKYLLDNDHRELLDNTFSCYSPVKVKGRFKMCGACPACIRFFLAAEGAEYDSIDRFNINPLDSETIKGYYDRTMTNVYTGRRCEQYRKVFEKYA
jgi:7-cyano-7-deazaguanine synthase in queuosine biosynthesis